MRRLTSRVSVEFEQRKERPRPRLRKRRRRQHGDSEVVGFRGDARDVGEPRVLRISLHRVDDGRDVAHHGARQPARHRLPVPLHEDIGDDRLQDQDRQDDDQDRADVEAFRHAVAEREPQPIEAEPPPMLGDRSPPALHKRAQLAERLREAETRADVADQGHGRSIILPGAKPSLLEGDSQFRAPSADARDLRDRPRSCGAAG